MSGLDGVASLSPTCGAKSQCQAVADGHQQANRSADSTNSIATRGPCSCFPAASIARETTNGHRVPDGTHILYVGDGGPWQKAVVGMAGSVSLRGCTLNGFPMVMLVLYIGCVCCDAAWVSRFIESVLDTETCIQGSLPCHCLVPRVWCQKPWFLSSFRAPMCFHGTVSTICHESSVSVGRANISEVP